MVNTLPLQPDKGVDQIIDPRDSVNALSSILSTPMGAKTIQCHPEFSFRDMLACLRGGIISAVFSCVLILFVAQGFMMNLIHPAANLPATMLWGGLQACVVACMLTGLVLMFVYSLECRKSLTIDPFGLVVNAKLYEGIETRLLVPWTWLARITVRKPAISWLGSTEFEMRTKYGTTYSLKWDEVMSSTVTETLIAAVKTLAPHAVIDFGDIQQERTDRQDSFTQLWLQSLSTSVKRERTGGLPEGAALNQDRYHIAGCLGSGGQGTAYLAVDSTTGTEVVLKEYILPVYGGQEAAAGSRQKLNREIALLSMLDHPHVVKLLDHFVEDYRGYIVLEFVSGVTLRQQVSGAGAHREQAVLDIAIAVCGILEYLHGLQLPVVHQDITPDNLIIQEDGSIKLVDFNVARQFSCDKTAAVVGRQAYIPPEQFRGKAEPASDIYALGCTMHWLLTGEDPEAMSSSHPMRTNKDVSTGMDRLVARATALSLSDRYANAQEMKKALEEYRDILGDGHMLKVS
jgi:tRNA A-37 threonylcarbamoyl transferase component Bud32